MIPNGGSSCARRRPAMFKQTLLFVVKVALYLVVLAADFFADLFGTAASAF